MREDKNLIGMQELGVSPDFTKKMALSALNDTSPGSEMKVAADIGGGEGVLSRAIASRFEEVKLLDYNASSLDTVNSKISRIQCDLNSEWPLPEDSVDFAFAIEVIEHIENPRHFLREMNRIVRKGGYIFVTTPNLHSLTSMLTFAIRGQHRYFQDASYPAHITALCQVDLERIGNECKLTKQKVYWSGNDRIPFINACFPLGGRFFSTSIGVLFKKGNSS